LGNTAVNEGTMILQNIMNLPPTATASHPEALLPKQNHCENLTPCNLCSRLVCTI